MGKLWDEFKKKAYYEEPTTSKGVRKKSTKELEEERNVADLRVKQIQSERKQLLNDYGIKTDETGNVKRTTEYNSNPLVTGSKYKKAELVDSENIKKEQEFKSSDKSEPYNALTKPLVENWNKRAKLNEEINQREAEEEAKGYGNIAKISASLGTGIVNKFSGLTRNNEDAILDENGNPIYYTKSRSEIDNEAYRNSMSGIAGGLYDLGNLVGEQLVQYIPGVGQATYFGDIAMDKYNENLRNGVDAKDAFINATGVSIVDWFKQKMLGSLGSRATGVSKGAEKSLENAFEKGFSHIIGNKGINQILAGTSAEFLDEFTDSIVEQMWDNITINKNGLFEGMDDPNFWLQAGYEGLLGGIMGLGGASIKVASKGKNQRNIEQSIYDYERKTGNTMSEANKQVLNLVQNTADEIGIKLNSEQLLDGFAKLKEQNTTKLLESANEARSTLNLNEQGSKLWDKAINQIAQVSYETNQPVKFDMNQKVLVRQEGNTLVFNPSLTDMPISNLVLREIAKNNLDDSTRTLILDKLKSEGVYDTFKEELLASGEFDEANVDNEIIASELDAIFSNGEEMAKLSENKEVFSGIKDTIDRISSALSKDPATKDSVYMKQLSDRIKEQFGLNKEKVNLNRISKELGEVAKRTQSNLEKSGFYNSSQNARILGNLITNISQKRGIEFDFTNNEQLAKEGKVWDDKSLEGYYTNTDGNSKVIVNLDSPRAINVILGHEILHSLRNSKNYNTLREQLFNYSKEIGDYEERLKTVNDLYSDIDGVDVEEELVANLVGDYVFTDEKFVNNLYSENKTLFQKILDELKYFFEQLTGSKEKKKLSKAIKTFEKIMNENVENKRTDSEDYMFMGKTGAYNATHADENNRQLLFNLSKAEKLEKQGLSNEEIRQKTYWFKNSDGEWTLEFPDKNANFKDIDIVENKEYKLSDIFNHKALFEAYPQLANQIVKFEYLEKEKNGMITAGYYEPYNNKITLNSDLLEKNIKDSDKLRKTLLHELQHRIQAVEKWGNGTDSENLVMYLNNKGEIMASEVENRSNLSFNELLKNIPESSKEYPIHPYLKEIHRRLNSNKKYEVNKAKKTLKDYQEVNKLYKEIYGESGTNENVFSKYTRENQDKILQKNLPKEILSNIRQWVNNRNKKSQSIYEENVTEDNKGRKLSEQQRIYFRNSKAVDSEGRLVEVYHGTTGGEFNIFDKSKGNVEGDFGSGFYFTNNEDDSERNYVGGGPDFESKVSRLAERIQSDEDISYEDAEKKARDMLYVGENKFTTYLKIENPAYVGETIIFDPDIYREDIETELSAEAEYLKKDIEEYAVEYFQTDDLSTLSEEEMKEARDEYLREYGIYDEIFDKYVYQDIDNAIDAIEDAGLTSGYYLDRSSLEAIMLNAFYDGGIKIEDLKKEISNKTEITNEEGDLANNEAVRIILESLGYDGIIDDTVSQKFKNMGLDADTTHYIVFNSNQIKNVDNLNPTENQDIRYSLNKKDANIKEYGNFNVYGSELQEGNGQIKDQYRSTEKLQETTKPGTYIEPSTPIKENKKSQKYLKQLTGESKIRSQLSKDYTSIVDKLHVIDILGKISGNKQLYAKYNNRGMSNGMGQYQVGTAQTDINGNKIGKSINEIWKPVENAKLTEEFDNYLAHRLNEERYSKVPVWDETVTPEISREIIDDYESKYPQFKEWAQDVYKFNDNQLQKMIDAGLSKENARDWLYSQYVTISREIGPKTNPLVQNAKGVKVNSPIRKAKGGNQEIRPMKESMARQTLLTERAIADNIAGQELLNVLGGTVGDTKNFLTQDLEGNNNALIENKDGTYNYTVYKNGVPVTMQVTKEIADAIRPTKIGEWENLGAFKVLRKASSIQRGLLTDKNPMFIFTNFFKDLGDAPLNSKYGAQLYAKYPSAFYKMVTNSKEWQQYVAKGGKSNSYFNAGTGEFTKSKNKFISAIQSVNEAIEQAPRFTEFLLTLEHGGTLDEALYNSAEVTTNFARGGEITKALNRNGATFLNASVQGFDKQIRNFTGQNGVRGYVNLLAKVAILGVAPAMLNHILLEDDDDYEELPDYIKDNYYLFKTGDNKFIRIPKGRAMSIFGDVARHSYEAYKGNETLLEGLKDTGEQFVNNVAPNNPLENNVLAPLIAVANNKSWNGSAIVSSTLQKQPEDLQYDERTSSIAKWLGKERNILGMSFSYSPKKIDYLLDQYTGAIGDIVLPATTPQAESESKNPLVSAFKNKFTTDSTISNKYVNEFYDKKNELEKENKRYSSIGESPEAYENALQYKYLDDVGTEIAKLYTEKREIQNSDLDDKTKYTQARAVQRQIDDLAKFAMQDYTEGYYTDSYAVIGDKEYYVNYKNGKASWNKVTEDTAKKQEEYAEKYDISPEGYYEMKPLTQYYSAGSIENYNKYYQEIKDIQSKTTKDKEETIKYINNLDLSIPQKAMMIKTYGYKFDDYNDEIFNYINSLDLIDEQKQEILIYLGFDYNKYTKQFSWK